MLPEGVRPRPPMRPAERSERMSPYRLGMTMTVSAKGAGSVAICGCQRHSSMAKEWAIEILAAHPEADSVEQVLIVRDVRVVLSNCTASSQKHAIGHLPTRHQSAITVWMNVTHMIGALCTAVTFPRPCSEA
jgi:hypothetical protein